MGNNTRYSIVDSLRGLAVSLMIVFHFCYDLTYFNYYTFDFYNDPFWLNFRSLIVSLFLLIAGVSLILVHKHANSKKKIIRRIIILSACSLLITTVSYFLFPGRTITFGIIHFITVASLLSLPFTRWPTLCGVLGVTLIYIGTNISHTFFDQAAYHWIGLMTHRPSTEDYVPLLPWLGVVLCGISIGSLLDNTPRGRIILNLHIDIRGVSVLTWLGTHSLAAYMLHQAILFSLFWLYTTLF